MSRFTQATGISRSPASLIVLFALLALLAGCATPTAKHGILARTNALLATARD